MKDFLEKLLSILTPREATVLSRLFGIPDEKEASLEEVAKELGLTIPMVRVLKAEALVKLRHSSVSRGLLETLQTGTSSDGIPKNRLSLFEEMIFKIAERSEETNGEGDEGLEEVIMEQTFESGRPKMADRTYWLDLFTWTTWKEFLDAGAEVSGFRERRRKMVQKIKPGDYLLCYLTGISRFIGLLEVTSSAFKDDSRIWKDEDFPDRIKVKPVVKLEPETAVPIFQLKDQLTIFQDLENPNAWTGHVRGSPVKWKASDGEVVVKALMDAVKNPVKRPVDPAKLARRPKALHAKIGAVTVPIRDEAAEDMQETPEKMSVHTEMQWLLLKLGSDMGLDVWVARNDRNRGFMAKKLSEIPRMKDSLPLQFNFSQQFFAWMPLPTS
jgi:predicted RNA-binding protein/DNA-binding CsgD family transcriptional regulator